MVSAVEKEIFNKGWALLNKYHNIKPEDNKKIWQELMEEASNLYETGKGSVAEPISKALALSIVETIENIYKEREGK